MLDVQKELTQNPYSESVTSFGTAAFCTVCACPNTLYLKETGTCYGGAQLQWVRRQALGKPWPLPVDCAGGACPYAGDIAVSRRGFGCGLVH